MKPDMLINGQVSEAISSSDRGIQYGDGLFETILVQAGRATFLDSHFERLQKGCDVLGFPAADLDLITSEIKQLIKPKQHGIVKVVLTRGVGERGFLPQENPNVTRMVSFFVAEKGVCEVLSSANLNVCETRLSCQPLLAGIKHLNQLERVLASAELRDTSCEGLMLDVNDVVIEGTTSNVFIVKDNALITPKLNQCGVAGVIRQFLMKQAKLEGITCHEAELSMDCITQADEIFLTNSLMPVRAIQTVTSEGEQVTMKKSDHAKWALNSVLNEIRQQVEC